MRTVVTRDDRVTVQNNKTLNAIPAIHRNYWQITSPHWIEGVILINAELIRLPFDLPEERSILSVIVSRGVVVLQNESAASSMGWIH